MNKKYFKIEINETLQRIIEVQASSLENAIIVARKKYYDEEIILDYSDHVDTEFSTTS